MTAIHLHLTSDVGTTYKRALERFHQSRDAIVPSRSTVFTLIGDISNWIILATQSRTNPMRKPRDFDAELKTLNDKARTLRARKVSQLGELVIACNADSLPIEQLAGALLATAKADAATTEAWRRDGAAFFRKADRDAGSDGGHASRAAARDGAAQSGAAKPSAQ